MEEADVSLQLLDAGWSIVKTPALRVFHDSELTHHASPEVNAAHITNTALLAYLRYPFRYWPLGVAQVLNRVRYSLRRKRYDGIGSGMFKIPSIIWRHRKDRKPVKASTISHARRLARGP
jgi:GT2 family glycosyltransferase